MAVTELKTSQQVSYGVVIKDATGAPAQVQGASWSVEGPVKIVASNPPVPTPPEPPVGTWGGGNVPMPNPPIANVPGAPGYTPPTQPPTTPPGSNLPPRPSHPDVGIPRPTPVKKRTNDESYTCTVAAVGGAVGPAIVSFSCDADLGDGEKLLAAVGAIAVVAGEATVVELEAGTPTEQGAPPQAKSQTIARKKK